MLKGHRLNDWNLELDIYIGLRDEGKGAVIIHLEAKEQENGDEHIGYIPSSQFEVADITAVDLLLDLEVRHNHETQQVARDRHLTIIAQLAEKKKERAENLVLFHIVTNQLHLLMLMLVVHQMEVELKCVVGDVNDILVFAAALTVSVLNLLGIQLLFNRVEDIFVHAARRGSENEFLGTTGAIRVPKQKSR